MGQPGSMHADENVCLPYYLQLLVEGSGEVDGLNGDMRKRGFNLFKIVLMIEKNSSACTINEGHDDLRTFPGLIITGNAIESSQE